MLVADGGGPAFREAVAGEGRESRLRNVADVSGVVGVLPGDVSLGEFHAKR